VAWVNYLAFFKPFEVLSQFTDAEGRATLKNYIHIPGIYAAGRLDYRSEGLLILSDDGAFIHRISDPRYDHPKIYLVQVEGALTPQDIICFNENIILPKIQRFPARAELVPEPDIPPRSKPVRDYHPTSWMRITLREGKKHQVRRMTAAIGFPTLRLVRVALGPVSLTGLAPGEWRRLTKDERLAMSKESHD
jgi:23S rRNA pseudouridine2457 synthase